MANEEGNVGASPYPIDKARNIMREFNIGLNMQNQILLAIATKFNHRRVDESDYMIALMDEIKKPR